MATTLGELAKLVGGQLHGDPSTLVTGAATLTAVKPGEITLVDCPDRSRSLATSHASAVVTSEGIAFADKPAIVVPNVHAAFAAIVRHFHPPRIAPRVGLSPQAFVDPTARLAPDVEVYAGATIGADVTIGPGSTIHSGVRILPGCTIGAGATLFPNAVLYERTKIGDRVIIHAGAVLGAYGFGYRQHEGRHVLSAQLGFVEIESDVEIGAATTIDRGTYGPTVIGAGTKIDNLVMIAHNCRLGRHNLICSQVGIAGSTTTGDYVVMAGQVGVRDHVHIGDHAVLCSKAGVPNDVPAHTEMLGAPAVPIRQAKLQMAAMSKLPEMRREFKIMQRQLAALIGEPPQADASADQAA